MIRYTSGTAFRRALEDRLNQLALSSNLRMTRLRKIVVFQRVLARLLIVAPDQWILKGGLALDFRLSGHPGARPRATKDMDLACLGGIDSADVDFRRIQELELADYFEFDIRRLNIEQEDKTTGEPAVRYQVRVILAGRVFEQVLIDVGFVPPATPSEMVTGLDLLGFAGLPPVRVPTLLVQIHVAEKVHAYTRHYGPDDSLSSRPKDLIDLVLLANQEQFVAQELRAALEQTFSSRGTHPLPRELPPPPDDWARPYRTLADEVGIVPDLLAGYQQMRAFLNPILCEGVDPSSRWNVANQRWIAP